MLVPNVQSMVKQELLKLPAGEGELDVNSAGDLKVSLNLQFARCVFWIMPPNVICEKVRLRVAQYRPVLCCCFRRLELR